MARPHRRQVAGGAAWLFLGLSAPLAAQPVQDEQRLQSVLDVDRPGYEPRQVKLGRVILSPELDLGVIYDSNVYAAHSDRVSDVMFRARPKLTARSNEGRVRWQAELSGDFRRYKSTSIENSDGYAATGTLIAALSDAFTANARGSYRRAVENRSDPEVRQNPTGGPPLINISSGEIGIRAGGARLGVSAKGLIERYDFISSLDDERDFTSYRGTTRLLYRLSPMAHVFVQGYVNQRKFRLREAGSGASRNGRTLGGLAGIQFDPGGKVRGDVGVGMFRYTAASARFASFSGFALEGNLTYTPRDRTAIMLDVFRGDVATVRNGASGRVDARARLGIQQEVRHNLLASAAVRFRETRYRGVSERLKTIGGDVELEYLFSRHVSVALVSQLARRRGGQLQDRFERARVGIELRMSY